MAGDTTADLDQARAISTELARLLAGGIRDHRQLCGQLGCPGPAVATTVIKLTDHQRIGLLFAALSELAGPDPRVTLPGTEMSQ